MNSDSSRSLIDRIVAWLRGLFAAGRSATGAASRDARRSLPESADTAREDAGAKVRDLADDRSPQRLPDLGDEPSDDEIDQRSDFDDAAGGLETGEETYPPAGTDLGAATRVHDAVGGEDERADDFTDGTIDATRDADLRPGSAAGDQTRDISLQDEIIVDEGASSDEFDGGEITPGDADNPYVTRDDVESAAEGYGDRDNTDLAATSDEGTSALTGSTFTQTDVDVPTAGEDDATAQPAEGDRGDEAGTITQAESGEFHVVERYNYGMGDLGVGGGTTPGGAWDDTAGPDVTTEDIDSKADASASSDATRADIESQSRGDAVNRSDEATQTPAFGAPETFDSTADGTIEPSRSAAGNELDEEQDALGTTLDHSEESDAVDDDSANLSGEDGLAVSDENIDYGAEGIGDVERVATFQSGTIAHEGLVGDTGAIDAEVTAEAYADLLDEPARETADDAGVDDFSGSDYPSDRRVDTLDGDDFADAEVPDVDDLDSSAGDLNTAPAEPSAPAGDASQHLDQDLVGTSDEHVGGEEPDLADAALSGSGGSDTDVPVGAVRGDGTVNTPEGYPVKGNASSMIYHLPSFPSYKSTKAEFCFATEQDALNAGYRAPGKRNRGKKA